MALAVHEKLRMGSETESATALERTAIPFVERVPAGKLIELSGTGAMTRDSSSKLFWMYQAGSAFWGAFGSGSS